MTATTTELMSAEQFFEWTARPENAGRHHELDRGRVVEVSRPGEAHGYVAANIARILGNFAHAQRKGYVCANDTGVIWERSPDTVRRPDVIYYDRKVRRRDLNPHYSDEVPKLAIEVLSPNDRMSKVNDRISKFLSWGVAIVWLADPADSTVTVYRVDRAPKVHQPEDEISGEEVLPDFRIRVAEFFALPGEDEPEESR